MNSPADIVAKYLIDQGVVADPTSLPIDTYPIFVGNLPDKPNKVVSSFDTKSRPDGRLMSGPTIFHPKVMLIIRSHDYRTAYDRANTIKEKIEAINRVTVSLGGNDYIIQSASFQTDILSLGIEEDKNNRHSMSINFSITLI